MSREKQRAAMDRLSAVLILQSYLDYVGAEAEGTKWSLRHEEIHSLKIALVDAVLMAGDRGVWLLLAASYQGHEGPW